MDEILNPTVFIGGLELREPVTTLTDFLVAIVALIGYIKFSKTKDRNHKGFNYFKYYFLFFAIGMCSAAWIGHGLQAYIDPVFKKIGWVFGTTGLLMLGLGSFIEIKTVSNPKWHAFFKNVFIVQYLFFVLILIHPNWSSFTLAQISSCVSLLVFILPIHIFNYSKQKATGSLIIISTICYSIFPGLVYNNQLSFSKWFNYHDISHVLMAIFMLLMIYGTSKLTLNSSSS